MAPKYVLHYFDARGRAEPTRWVFAYAGVDYEDRRFGKEEWPAIKANSPFGQAPWLEVDGKPLPQSVAITRYVARQHGLVPKDDFEAAHADALVDYVQDIMKGLISAVHEKDEKKKVMLMEKYFKAGVQPYLQGLEKHLRANNNGEGFFVGSKPIWADFAIVVFFDSLIKQDNNVLDNYPLLKAHSQRVHDLKGIKEWLLKRPVTVN